MNTFKARQSTKDDAMKTIHDMIDNLNGKVGVPILLYILGVPGFLVILVWLFFFRGT